MTVLYADSLFGVYALGFVIAAVISALLTPIIRRYALKNNLGVVEPRDRDVHTGKIPRLGGVAVSIAFFVTVIGFYLYDPTKLSFINQHIFYVDRNLLGILLGVIILLAIGIRDDIKGVSPQVKLLTHIAVGVVLAWSTVLVPHITNPFGGKIELGWLVYPFVVGWVVFMINAINWLDGLDGLASGLSLIASLILFILAIKPEVNQLSMALLAIILTGALAGFLPYNFTPAKIFLGDSGSQVLGFLLAVFAIISGGKLATAFLVLGVPILDVIWVISRRILARQPVYRADRFHLHHRLLRAGFNQRQAVLLIYTISAAFGIIALQAQSYGKLVAIFILVVMMVIGGISLVAIDRRKQEAQ